MVAPRELRGCWASQHYDVPHTFFFFCSITSQSVDSVDSHAQSFFCQKRIISKFVFFRYGQIRQQIVIRNQILHYQVYFVFYLLYCYTINEFVVCVIMCKLSAFIS
jgi:hypothetical protein